MSVPNDELEKLLKQLDNKNKLVAKSFLSWLLEQQLDNEDDELTPEDIASVIKGHQEYELGLTRSMEDLKRELDI